MAAVVFALKIWRSYLYGGKVRVFTDHKSTEANLVADALSRKRVALARKREVDSLVSEISTLRLCVVSREPLGLEAVNHADLLSECGWLERRMSV
ncbi:hypothetical protein V5N11_003014 [Cardamine amara subsp. amara]|uniref:Reverse transcriptase RNase H-like domain-containing protein n=1 Tax=Cardamine amara subsp. amara TaxID=228776 RepID=A0ABD0ZVW1_CARAN